MILKITSYDLLRTPIKKGQIYFITDTRTLYKDYSTLAVDRRIYPAVVVNTDNERVNKLRPANGVNYYVIESNCLWCFDTKWVLKNGQVAAVPYNTYYIDNTEGASPYISQDEFITGKYGDKIIDNNGLMGNGAVVIRDPDRMQRGRLEANTAAQEISILSFLDNGIGLYPYGGGYNANIRKITGSLHLGVEMNVSENLVDPVTTYDGYAEYFGKFNVHGDVRLVVSDEFRDRSVYSVPEPNDAFAITGEFIGNNLLEPDNEYLTRHIITIRPQSESAAKVEITLLSTLNEQIPPNSPQTVSYEYQKKYIFIADRQYSQTEEEKLLKFIVPGADIVCEVKQGDYVDKEINIIVNRISTSDEIFETSEGTFSVQTFHNLSDIINEIQSIKNRVDALESN